MGENWVWPVRGLKVLGLTCKLVYQHYIGYELGEECREHYEQLLVIGRHEELTDRDEEGESHKV